MAKTILYELVAKFDGDTTGLMKATNIAEQGLKKLAMAAAAAAGPTAIGALTIASLKQIDADLKLANSLGISIKALKAMTLVSGEAGVETGSLTAALQIMQRNLFSAATAAGPQREAIQALGLNIKELINLAPDQQFAKIAQAITSIENPTLRAGLAAEVFGRNARQLLNVFESYGERVNEATRFNEKWNISLSQIDATKVEQANDAFGRIGSAIGGIGNTIAIEVAPSIEALSQAITDATFKADDLTIAVRNSMDGLAVFAEFLRRAWHGLEVTLSSVSLLLNGINSLGMPLEDRKRIAQESADNLREVIDSFDSENTMVVRLYKARYDAEQKALDSLRTRGSSGANGPDLEGISSIFGSEKAAQEAAKATRERFQELKQSLRETQQEMRKLGDDTGRVFAGFVTSLFSGESALDSLKNKVLDVLNSIVESMFQLSFGGSGGGGFAGMIASALFGAFGFGGGFDPAKGPPPPKPFAKGGAFLNSATMFPMSTGMGVAGEAGPEAIMPLVRGPGGKLGVSASGGSPSIVQNLNFSVGVQQTVRAEILRLMPQIKAASLEGVQDASNRGSFKPA